jgi:hypothetical protein
MKLTKLHLIIILALTLILCPILGVCNNTRESFDQFQSTNEGFEEEEKEEGFKEVEEGFRVEGYRQNDSEEGFKEEEEEGFEGLALQEGLYAENREGLSGDYQQYQD